MELLWIKGKVDIFCVKSKAVSRFGCRSMPLSLVSMGNHPGCESRLFRAPEYPCSAVRVLRCSFDRLCLESR